jgi:osmoprotectant transport system ATP-binding protein
MINRLIEPTAGRVLLDGADVARTDPVALRRRIGYVIQDIGLFPHHTVRGNVGTVPRLLRWGRRRTAARIDELLRLVGLEPGQFGDRYPHELSGGQRQRVGVARALAADPVLLLMDEPFSAVDPIVRARLQDEFLRLQAEMHKTIVLVTHDLDEAVRLGDRIAVLSQGGRLEQYATPGEVLGAPVSDFVREFVGADRAIRRLAVTPITADILGPPPEDREGPAPAGPMAGGRPVPLTAGTGPVPSVQSVPPVPLGSSRYDALAAMLTAGTDRIGIADSGGTVIGVLTRDAIFTTDR